MLQKLNDKAGAIREIPQSIWPKSSLTEESNPNQSEKGLNIIFLDIMYVLYEKRMLLDKTDPHLEEKISGLKQENSYNYYLSAAQEIVNFSTKAVENLRRLCIENNAQIVISSPWNDKDNLSQLKILFSVSNFGEHILDSISEISRIKIEKWLVNHFGKINSFVILSGRHCSDEFSRCFGDRHVHCDIYHKQLFSDNDLFNRATHILKKTLQFNTSIPKLLLDAIESNSPQITHVEFNIETICALQIGLGLNKEMVVNRLFYALEKNKFITHLIFQDFNQEEMNSDLLEKISSLLSKNIMKLQYLSIASNRLRNFNALLSIVDGYTLHIPHICFNANPLKIEAQKYLAAWMKTYPRPIYIDLDLSDAPGKYPLDGFIIDAVDQNENIYLHTKKELFVSISSTINKESLDSLVTSGRINLNPNKSIATINNLVSNKLTLGFFPSNNSIEKKKSETIKEKCIIF